MFYNMKGDTQQLCISYTQRTDMVIVNLVRWESLALREMASHLTHRLYKTDSEENVLEAKS